MNVTEDDSERLAQRARAAGLSQDYFLMWDMATQIRDIAEATGNATCIMHAGLLVVMVEERLEELIESKTNGETSNDQ